MAGVARRIADKLGLTVEAVAKFGNDLDSPAINAVEAKVRAPGTVNFLDLPRGEQNAVRRLWNGLTDALEQDSKTPAEIAQIALRELTQEFGGGQTGRAHAIEFMKLAVQSSDAALAARPRRAEAMVRLETGEAHTTKEAVQQSRPARPAIDHRAIFDRADQSIKGNAFEIQEALRQGRVFGRSEDIQKVVSTIRTEMAHRDAAAKKLGQTTMTAGESTKPGEILSRLANGGTVTDTEFTRLKNALLVVAEGKPSAPPGTLDKVVHAIGSMRKTGGAPSSPLQSPASALSPKQTADIMDGQTLTDVLAAEARSGFRKKLALAGAGTVLVGALSTPSQDSTPGEFGASDIPIVSGLLNWAAGIKIPVIMDEDSLGVGFAKRSYNSPGGLMTGVREYTSNGKMPHMASAYDQEAMGEVAVTQLGKKYETLGFQSAIVAYRMNGQEKSDITYRNEVIRRVASGTAQAYETDAAALFMEHTSGLKVGEIPQIRGVALQYLSGAYGGQPADKAWADKEILRLATGGKGVSSAEQALGTSVQAAIKAQVSGANAKESQAQLVEDIVNQAAGRGPETTTVNADAYYQKWTNEFNVAAVGFTEQLQKVGIDIAGNEANIQATINDAALSVMYNGPVSSDGSLPAGFNTRLQGELTKRFQEGGLTRTEVEVINYVTSDPVNNMEAALKRAAAAQAAP